MQKDFHYYATYCAATLAGYDHQESLAISYSDQMADWCTVTFLESIGAPTSAATTQMQLELMKVRTDPIGLQDITRIWSSFHFLPGNLEANPGKGGRRYREKYRLICDTNGPLVAKTVELAKGRSPQAVGLAMHVVADTWAHRYFAGTPSLAINNTNRHFFEIIEGQPDRQISFGHVPGAADDLENGNYNGTIYQASERSIMNLGHGRAGHFPDYSFAKYRYLPAWADYEEVLKDNPSDYYQAFCQVVYALRYLHGDVATFECDHYDYDIVAPYEDEIREIINVRVLENCEGWKRLGEKLSGHAIEDFDMHAHEDEYKSAPADQRDDTFLGRYILAALAQKSMVTHEIFASGNRLAGRSIEYQKGGFAGIRDYLGLVNYRKGASDNE